MHGNEKQIHTQKWGRVPSHQIYDTVPHISSSQLSYTTQHAQLQKVCELYLRHVDHLGDTHYAYTVR